ncbi:GNAT family N-acetyltransferase [Clostridium sp.]|uniref:GNAT family N-acetyltransferase n=1 Tax=Clostridium sp. TaxID=1506 RepID=UPI001A4138AD|nr:GNAT family N-acetyltransferase [Clostridium sp.]MBK5242810.1 GNAT family N-acetyltransferase [Clostridium sp.]
MVSHAGTTYLETERLILRRFIESDAEDMFNNWASDSEVTKFLTWPNHGSVKISREIINTWINSYKDIENYQWAIELKESKSVIGSASLMDIDNHNEHCEIGYCLGQSFWNKGIMTEAFLKIIDFAFCDLGFQRITGRHEVDNTASGCVMEKCGLAYEGTLRKILKNNKGILVDCKYYSILKGRLSL